MYRFVRPDTTVLALSDGDTVTIRTRLNAGERRALLARTMEAGPDGRWRLNMVQTGLALVTAYLVDWSLRDDTGVVPIRGVAIGELETVLNNLDSESFTEILHAIERHEKAMDDARAEEKKLRAGSLDDEATSRSRYVVVGGSSGFVS